MSKPLGFLLCWALSPSLLKWPIRRPGKLPTPDGNIVSPSIGGGTNWWSAAYSPRTELYYVNAYDGEQEFFIREEEYREGEQFTGGGAQYVKPAES